MQQSLRPFDGTGPRYTTEIFLNAITAYMVITAGTEQVDSTYHEAWDAMIQTKANRQDTDGFNRPCIAMVLTFTIRS